MATAQLPILRQPVNEECIYDETGYILNRNPMVEVILPSGIVYDGVCIQKPKKVGYTLNISPVRAFGILCKLLTKELPSSWRFGGSNICDVS